ncbi:MAG: hypothetical protein QOG62_529 [Thermoleophilaceae bacterium]|jgi:hypothetical protein|nr:hypothetical protein [Thermoleophilaceae bacterium]
MQVATHTSGAENNAGPVLRGLGAAGGVMIAVGVGMLLMPFVGPLVGIPFDGAQAFVLDRNRFLLHVFPGAVGLLTGLALLHAQRMRTRKGLAYPEWLKPAIAIAVIVGIWNGVGPWVLQSVLPASSGTSLMFTNIQGFGGMSGTQQFLLEMTCHWLPGVLALGAAWVAYVLVRRLPGNVAAS